MRDAVIIAWISVCLGIVTVLPGIGDGAEPAGLGFFQRCWQGSAGAYAGWMMWWVVYGRCGVVVGVGIGGSRDVVMRGRGQISSVGDGTRRDNRCRQRCRCAGGRLDTGLVGCEGEVGSGWFAVYALSAIGVRLAVSRRRSQ